MPVAKRIRSPTAPVPRDGTGDRTPPGGAATAGPSEGAAGRDSGIRAGGEGGTTAGGAARATTCAGGSGGGAGFASTTCAGGSARGSGCASTTCAGGSGGGERRASTIGAGDARGSSGPELSSTHSASDEDRSFSFTRTTTRWDPAGSAGRKNPETASAADCSCRDIVRPSTVHSNQTRSEGRAAGTRAPQWKVARPPAGTATRPGGGVTSSAGGTGGTTPTSQLRTNVLPVVPRTTRVTCCQPASSGRATYVQVGRCE